MALSSILRVITDITIAIWRDLVSFFKCGRVIGITPNEVLFDGVPLWKTRTIINWPTNVIEQNNGPIFSRPHIKMTTSNTKAVVVSFFTLQGEPVSRVFDNPESNLEVEVWLITSTSRSQVEASITEVDSNVDDEDTSNKIQIIFSGQRVGKYSVILFSNGNIVRDFPTEATIVPGDADPLATCVVENSSKTIIITADCTSEETIRVEPRDMFGNKISNTLDLETLANRFKVALWRRVDSNYEREDTVVADHHFVVYRGVGRCGECLNISLSFAPSQEGWYAAKILLDGQHINMKQVLTLIVISEKDNRMVKHVVSRKELRGSSSFDFGSIYFESELVSVDEAPIEKAKKPRKVFVYLTGKQLTIKEYFFKIIPSRLYTFRLAPTTRINLVHMPAGNVGSQPETSNNQYQSFSSAIVEIDDGCQARPRLIFKDEKFSFQDNGAILFAACYHKLLLNRLGGSETFQAKQDIFNKRLVEYHLDKGNKRGKLSLTIERWCIVNSSLQATKWLTDAQWAQLFEIHFEGEEGIDQGGLRREWFEVLCRELFKPDYKLFVQSEDGSDAIHPNPFPEVFGRNAMKVYKFAGKVVGKCLLESAQGSTYRQQLPIRLAKSFLASIVGLRVQYKHFAHDTPEFYTSKIRSILMGNVEAEDEGMNDLTFSEELYENNMPGTAQSKVHSTKTVELKPGGSKAKVTQSNKYQYLDLLAQYRLCNRFKEQTNAFLDGLHRLVPDSLLSLFDEDELELLLCGIREYNLSDLKQNHTIVGGILSAGPSRKMLNWFWVTIENFTTEQMARLVQFTTGSSQLPHGGFAELKPIFQIMGSGEKNSLPTAHTCFNMICIPEHDNFSGFEQAMLTAITDGNEGFGLV